MVHPLFLRQPYGVNEAISWAFSLPDQKVAMESDSLLTLKAVNGTELNLLEAGNIIDRCRAGLAKGEMFQ